MKATRCRKYTLYSRNQDGIRIHIHPMVRIRCAIFEAELEGTVKVTIFKNCTLYTRCLFQILVENRIGFGSTFFRRLGSGSVALPKRPSGYEHAVVVVCYVTVVTIGHGLSKKFWPKVIDCVLCTAGRSII